jgi:putative toxin-antitoxin system antitoxin component (TIGR02293 family)
MVLSTEHKSARSRSGRTRQLRTHFKRLDSDLAALPTGKLLQLVQQGLPFKIFAKVSAQTRIPLRELAAIIEIPERTLARRRVAGRLGRDESERLLRLARVVASSTRLFEGDIDAALTWLKTPQKALSHNTPLSYARFEIGAREVEDLIGRIEHGVFS